MSASPFMSLNNPKVRDVFEKSTPEEILAAMMAAVLQERERYAKIAETCAGEYCAGPPCCSSEIAAKIRSGE